VKEKDRADSEIICKYLPDNINSVFGPGIQGDNDAFTPLDWLMEAIQQNLQEEVAVPRQSEMKLDTSEVSLTFSSNLLESYDFDFEKLVAGNEGTTIDFAGSEFRPIASLERILGGHTNFEFFRNILTNRMSYVFTRELTEEECALCYY
jgi:hypothetical protein